MVVPLPADDAASGVRTVVTVRRGRAERRPDSLAGEEPMAIRVAGPGQAPIDVAVTMRTRGHDDELAVGFLCSEGLVSPDDVERLTVGDPARVAIPENELLVHLRRQLDPARIPARSFVASASCGICGKASLDDITLRCDPLAGGPVVEPRVLLGLPSALRAGQAVFDRTGGLHAAGLFEASGAPIVVREDIGRHNAVDKLVGWAALAGRLPLRDRVLLVSGRASFEIVQKAAMAGIAFVAAVSAPSDLAVVAAERVGMTLVGFLRGEAFNVYAGEERVAIG